jgi:hypothetical protein
LCGIASRPGVPGSFTEAVADSGSCLRAKYGGVRTENRASSAPSPCSHASWPTVRSLQKRSRKSVVRRPPSGCQLARTRHSTLAGGNRPPRLGAVGPDLESGSPPDRRNPPVSAPLESPDTAADAAAAPKSSSRTDGTDNVPLAPDRCLQDPRSACSVRGNAPSPDNRADTPAEIL